MTSDAGRSHALTAALVFAVSAALVLVGIELALRWKGHRPWQVATVDANEPTIHVPDPVLGWRAKPGSHVVPPYTPDAEPIEITFLADGARSTGLGTGGSGPTLLFAGASFTQGWAVSDRQTFASKLQERFPRLRIRNYGTGGYSTFQSLMSLERLLAQGPPPDRVFYSLVDDLERRNVATPEWLRLLARFSRRGAVDVPFCTLRDGELVRHPPHRYPEWPLREQLASVALAQRVYNERRGRERPPQARAVTMKLLLEMRDLVEERGIGFTVVLLHFFDPSLKAHYAGFLAGQSIDFVDCAFPLTPDMRVEGEGHANGKMHTRWANCIGRAIEQRLSEEKA